MKGILIAAYVEGIRTRKDKTCAITISTQELTPERAGELFSLNGQIITAYFSQKEISTDDREVIDSIEPDLPGKSPSQRLRSVLYLLWKQDPQGFKDKNLHYLHLMEKIIDFYKGKLDAETH